MDDGEEGAAYEGFCKVLELEAEAGSKSEYTFDSVVYLVRLGYSLGKGEDSVLEYLGKQLDLGSQSIVSRNHAEKALSEQLDFFGRHAVDTAVLGKVYEVALGALTDDAKLRFKILKKLAHLYLDNENWPALGDLLGDLYATCEAEGGTGAQTLDVYAIHIQMCTATRDRKKLSELYEKSLRVSDAISHPRTLGVIRECGGKNNLSMGDYDAAVRDFFESFKAYDNASDSRAIQCLQLLLLSSMLAESEADPMAANEVKGYVNNQHIKSFVSLVQAYQRDDLAEFERVLRTSFRSLDSFLATYIDDLRRNVRTNVILSIIAPYTNISIPFIAKKLKIPERDVESLLIALILDSRIAGYIDQVQQRLVLTSKTRSKDQSLMGLNRWIAQIDRMSSSLQGKTQ